MRRLTLTCTLVAALAPLTDMVAAAPKTAVLPDARQIRFGAPDVWVSLDSAWVDVEGRTHYVARIAGTPGDLGVSTRRSRRTRGEWTTYRGHQLFARFRGTVLTRFRAEVSRRQAFYVLDIPMDRRSRVIRETDFVNGVLLDPQTLVITGTVTRF